MSMTVPRTCKYTKEHEWVRVDGDVATIGITRLRAGAARRRRLRRAAREGRDASRKFASFGVVESVKAASDIYAPVSGEVVERNETVVEKPELVNDRALRRGLDDRGASSPTRPSSTSCMTRRASTDEHIVETARRRGLAP